MKVKFRTTLGSRGAAACTQQTGHVLDHAQCAIGAEVTVSEDAAAWLAARGLIEDPPKAKKPAELKAVPEKPVISKATEPTVKK